MEIQRRPLAYAVRRANEFVSLTAPPHPLVLQVPIHLVRGRIQHRQGRRSPAYSFEHIQGTEGIRFEVTSGIAHRGGDRRLRSQMQQSVRIRVPVDEVVHFVSRCYVQAFEHMVGDVLLQPAEIVCRTTAGQVVDTDCLYAGHLRHVIDERRPDEPR